MNHILPSYSLGTTSRSHVPSNFILENCSMCARYCHTHMNQISTLLRVTHTVARSMRRVHKTSLTFNPDIYRKQYPDIHSDIRSDMFSDLVIIIRRLRLLRALILASICQQRAEPARGLCGHHQHASKCQIYLEENARSYAKEMSDRMSLHMSEHMPGCMPEKMTEYTVCKRTCQNTYDNMCQNACQNKCQRKYYMTESMYNVRIHAKPLVQLSLR